MSAICVKCNTFLYFFNFPFRPTNLLNRHLPFIDFPASNMGLRHFLKYFCLKLAEYTQKYRLDYFLQFFYRHEGLKTAYFSNF